MIRSRVQHGGHEVKLTVRKFRIQKDLKFKLLTNMAFNFPRSAKKCSRKKSSKIFLLQTFTLQRRKSTFKQKPNDEMLLLIHSSVDRKNQYLTRKTSLLQSQKFVPGKYEKNHRFAKINSGEIKFSATRQLNSFSKFKKEIGNHSRNADARRPGKRLDIEQQSEKHPRFFNEHQSIFWPGDH